MSFIYLVLWKHGVELVRITTYFERKWYTFDIITFFSLKHQLQPLIWWVNTKIHKFQPQQTLDRISRSCHIFQSIQIDIWCYCTAQLLVTECHWADDNWRHGKIKPTIIWRFYQHKYIYKLFFELWFIYECFGDIKSYCCNICG